MLTKDANDLRHLLLHAAKAISRGALEFGMKPFCLRKPSQKSGLILNQHGQGILKAPMTISSCAFFCQCDLQQYETLQIKILLLATACCKTVPTNLRAFRRWSLPALRWTDQLARLSLGSKVFAYIKGKGGGYVGFGEVIQEACPVKDFTPDGHRKPLLDFELSADMAHNRNDPNKCEWVVGVKWKKTIPRE